VALRREIKEEIRINTKNERLFAVVENFFERKGYSVHEIGFYYVVIPVNELPKEDFSIDEVDKGIAKKLDFKWVSFDEVKDINLRPYIVRDLVAKSGGNGFTHLIYRD